MKLGSAAIELINRNELTAELLARGWNVFLPVYDEGIDLLAKRIEVSETVIQIQLKSRWTIDRKYVGRQIEIAFRAASDWYLVPHDVAVTMGAEAGFCATQSWLGSKGQYHVSPMSSVLKLKMQAFTLNARLGPRLVQT